MTGWNVFACGGEIEETCVEGGLLRARVDFDGVSREIAYAPGARVAMYCLFRVGFAIRSLHEEETLERWIYLGESTTKTE